MSTSGTSPDVRAIADVLDPRLRASFLHDVAHAPPAAPLTGIIVLVGHRAAGKTRVLPHVARLAGRSAVDLDRRVEETTGRRVRDLFLDGEGAFRELEARTFLSLHGSLVVAAGGGFLAHHAALLRGHTAVLVPVTPETYRERLAADVERPRLRPDLSLDEEITAVFREREALHARADTLPLAHCVAALLRGGA